MQKSLKTLGLAGVAMAMVMTPAMVAAQDQSGTDTTTETMPPSSPGTTTTAPTTPGTSQTYPDTSSTDPSTTPPSMPDTTPDTGTGQEWNNTGTPPAQAPSAMSTADQDTKVQSWPAEQQTAYKAWSPETQTYFWSLTEERQKIFWRINDADKTTLATMAEPQRESTWAELEARLKTTER
jgi:hypothetical protein